MSPSDQPNENQCSLCDYKTRVPGISLKRHVSSVHGKPMPCGDYVPEGKGDDGQDRAKEHLDSWPRRARGSKSPSGDDTDRSSTGTPELDASAKGHLDDSSRSPPDSKSSSGDDSDRSSAGTPKTSARVGSDETFTQPAISIRGMKVTARRAVFQNLVVSQTNNHTV